MNKFMKHLLTLTFAGSFFLSPAVSVAQGTRLSGSNRYGTNCAVVESLSNKSKMAVLTSGKNFPDALSAYNISKKHQAPIVLMDSSLDETFTMLIRLDIQEVILVGGPASISKDLERQLGIYFKVSRIFGANRYETSKKTYEATKDYFGSSTPLVQTTGEHFQEPLIASAYASAKNQALVLSQNMGRYTLSTGSQGTIYGSSIDDFNRKIMDKIPSSRVVMAHVNSFPDSLSSVNYASLMPYKIHLVSSVKETDQYDLVVGGPETLAIEVEAQSKTTSQSQEEPIEKPASKPFEQTVPYDPQGKVQLAQSAFNEAHFNEAFLKLVNEERASLGLKKVSISDIYVPGVQIRVKSEASASVQDHKMPDGSGFWTAVEPQMNAKGMRNNWIGEILAVEYSSNDPQSLAKEAFKSWKNSPGHYAIMTDSRATQMYISKATISQGQWKGYEVVIAIFGQPVKK